MIGLTARQSQIARIVIVAQSEGRKLTFSQLAGIAGLSNRSVAFAHVAAIRVRFGAGVLETIVPRGPHGERLRFIPIGERSDG